MTTIFNFQPNPNGPFSFQPTLDGNLYTVSVPWSLFGNRWYVQCTDLANNLIFYRALVGSPTGVAIQALEWSKNQVFVTAIVAHGFRVGQTAKVTIAGCAPDAYNGTFIALATTPDTMVFSLSTNPGAASLLGVINQDINLAAAFFQSKIVYREDKKWFEVSP